MENFVVSARKYRPITFETVVGQTSITNTLKNAIKNNHLAQAFLFCGPRGVGKTTCARILAKTINCYNITDKVEPCNVCESCLSFNQSHSFNIHELDAASNNSVDDIRNLVDMVRFAPQVGKYSIYIIDEVHMLSANAFNAFLKTLEEPPSYAKFILATTERHKILPTILSRCQVFDFRRITNDDIVKHLHFVAEKEGIKADSDALHVIAHKADGALRDALSIFDQVVSAAGNTVSYSDVTENLNVLNFSFLYNMTEYCRIGDISKAMLLLNEILYLGFDGHNFLLQLAEHFRNLMVCKDQATISLLEAGDSIKAQYKEQSAKTDVLDILNWLDALNKCDVQYNSNRNKRLLLEITLMQICSLKISRQVNPILKESSSATPINTPVSTEKKNESPKPTSAEIKVVEPLSVASKNAPAPVSSSMPKISISNTKEQIKPSQKEEGSEAIATSGVTKAPSKFFTQEGFMEVWNKYASKHVDDNPSLYSFLSSRQPILKDNFVVEIGVENKVQQNELDEYKVEMISFLRNELSNFDLHLEFVSSRVQIESKPYTNAEKFKAMAEKYPAIIDLKKQLDLEMDY